MQVKELIERAKERTGSDVLTAQALGVSAQRLSDYKHGREPCPLRKQAALCEIAALSASDAWEHMKVATGADKPKRRASTSARALAFAGSLVSVAALNAALFGGRSLATATMYRPVRREPAGA